jgi:hypothetical protein
MIPIMDHKQHRSITNIKLQTSTINRMKRKISATNSDVIHPTKKLDGVKSKEFEPKDQ